MSRAATAGTTGYTIATNPTGIAGRLRRRARWALPMVGWNLGMVALSSIEHAPAFMVLALGTLVMATVVVVSEPDDIED